MVQDSSSVSSSSGLNASSNVDIGFGSSQGTSGYDSQFTFSGIAQEVLDLIELNCDDTDLAAMDTNGNLEITMEEFQTWYDENEPW